MNETIISNINKMVMGDDYLVSLGDWSFKSIDEIYENRKKINCKNIIHILGNHCEKIAANKELPNWTKESDRIQYAQQCFTSEFIGTLNNHMHTLHNNGIKIAYFKEPDLGDQLTAVVFLVDERVWDKEKYPDRDINPQPSSDGISTIAIHIEPESIEEYKNRLRGEQNVWLREFLKQFRLA